jgi:4-hydroxy-tetrahydrodipicolinate synthase
MTVLSGLSGLVPILATPFSGDGSLDLASLARLVEYQVASGADGVATFGLASETFTLSARERGLVLDTVVRTVRSASADTPVVAGISATGLYPAVEQGKAAVDGGADALMVLPPFLVRPSDDQLTEFFGELAAAAGVPVMMQDAPALTGVAMSVRLITDIGMVAGVDYVKIEAQPTAPKVASVASAVANGGASGGSGGKLRVLGGQNAQFLLDELERGAIGTMPACEFTDLLAQVMSAWNAGNRDEAEVRFYRLLPLLVYGLQSGIAWAVHKEVLVRRGIIADAEVRSPARPLDAASAAGLLRLLRPLESEPGWRRHG